MAIAQSPHFGYCATYNYFPNAILPIICLLHIDKLFHHSKSSIYFITAHRKNVWKLQIAYLEIFRRFIRRLHKAQFLGYRASIILLLRISQLFTYCKWTNYFTTGNRLNIWLLCIGKLYDNFKSPIWKHFEDLYGYCAKANFLATAQHTNNNLLRICQLFIYCKATNYFTTGNRLNICFMCIVKLYDNFKSPICK